MDKQKIILYLKTLSLPVGLAILFALQNLVFNIWLKIFSDAYSVRLFGASLALGIVFFGPSLLFRRKYSYIYLFISEFLVSTLLTAQFLYYRYSQSFLQFSAIKYINQTASVAGTIKSLFTPELFFFFTGFFIVLASLLISRAKKFPELFLSKLAKIIIFAAMCAIVFFGYQYLLYTERREWGNTIRLYTDAYDLKMVVGKMGILNFLIEDSFKYISAHNKISDTDRDFLKNYAENKKNEAVKSAYGAAKGKNLIIIEVESLENAVINKTISGQEITPNLNKLAEAGLYFDNYYAQIGPGNTADAEFSTMTSLYPLPNDVVFIDYAENTYDALPALLAKNGYKTYSMHGDVPTFWNRSNIYPVLGYQKTYGLADYIVTRPVGEGPSDLGDEDLFSQSLPRMESFPQPFMASLITMSLHTPFILPADLQTLNIAPRTNLTETQWEYMQAVHYTDKAIGEFIDALKNNGLYENSLILIFGDHQSFQNIYSVLSPDNLNADPQAAQLYKNLDVGVINRESWNNNVLPALQNSQVPMIILAPGTGLKGKNSIPASHLDVYPTIANLLGIQAPKTLFGQDLLNTKNPVETHFRSITGGIDAILTDKLAYQAGADGVFAHGSCEIVPDKKSLPISDCQKIYTEQFNAIKASNIIIRGNLLNFYSANIK